MRISLFVLKSSLLLLVLLNQIAAEGQQNRINGVCFTGPPQPLSENPFPPVKALNASWVAVTPYAFGQKSAPYISFDNPRQWWGEKSEGIRATIGYAREKGLKVMMKPHVWVRGDGWCGDFECRNDAEWKLWEEDYARYILAMGRLAEELEVEMFCIGTEYRKAVVQRPEFWKKLIADLQKIYSGKLTYAANWDNFENVPFWKELDYIGIDAYFPLLKKKTPTDTELLNAWLPLKKHLEKYSRKLDRPVLFTEYGYRSVDFNTHEPWKTDAIGKVNPEAQIAAYEALFCTFWSEDWFAGGFLWKWFADHTRAGGSNHDGFTPQNKPVSQTISEWYKGK